MTDVVCEPGRPVSASVSAVRTKCFKVKILGIFRKCTKTSVDGRKGEEWRTAGLFLTTSASLEPCPPALPPPGLPASAGELQGQGFPRLSPRDTRAPLPPPCPLRCLEEQALGQAWGPAAEAGRQISASPSGSRTGYESAHEDELGWSELVEDELFSTREQSVKIIEIWTSNWKAHLREQFRTSEQYRVIVQLSLVHPYYRRSYFGQV